MNAMHAHATAAPPSAEDDLLRSFEDCTLDPAKFTHRCHLAVGWAYLRRHGFPEGAVRFRSRLSAYVASVGATGKYHETITWAYLVLMNEEMTLRSSPAEGFDQMILRRPDLLDHRNGAIARCYSRADLDHPDARKVFMLPAAAAR